MRRSSGPVPVAARVAAVETFGVENVVQSSPLSAAGATRSARSARNPANNAKKGIPHLKQLCKLIPKVNGSDHLNWPNS